jgi:hypothetical protein
MRALSLLVLTLACASSSLAQSDAPAPVATPEPLAPEVPVVPPVTPPPVTPPPDAKPAPATPVPDARTSEGCAVWPGALGGLAGFGGTAAVGGLLFCVGGLMASIPVESNNDNCAEACVEAAAAAFMVFIGAIIAVAGIIALGPIAAIAGTIGAAVGSAGAGRKVWPSVVGGSVGIALSLAGIGLAVYGLNKSPTIPFLASTPFNEGDEGHVAMVAGVGLAALSGIVSLGGAVVADAVLGGPDTP